MVECFSQPSAVVRLRHHPQVSDLAEPQAQSHRGIRQLLRHARRLPPNASRRGAQRSHQDGSAGTAVQPQRGKLPFRTIVYIEQTHFCLHLLMKVFNTITGHRRSQLRR